MVCLSTGGNTQQKHKREGQRQKSFHAFASYRDEIVLMIFAGMPPTMFISGASFVTTAQADTMVPSPMVTPGATVAFDSIYTFCQSRWELVSNWAK